MLIMLMTEGKVTSQSHMRYYNLFTALFWVPQFLSGLFMGKMYVQNI